MLGVQVPSVTPSSNIPGVHYMLIARKRNKKEISEKERGKARRRAVLVGRVCFLAVIVGLLGLFAYNNADYFSLSVERAALSVENRKHTPSAARGRGTDMLGGPEFFDSNDAVPLNSLIRERMAVPDSSSQIQPALLSQPTHKDTVRVDTAPRPLAAPSSPDAEKPVSTPRLAIPGANMKNPPPQAAGNADLTAAKSDTAPVKRISLTPVPGQDTAARVKPVSGSMLISNVNSRLADRSDISVDVSVELFYDSEALRDELHAKRAALTAVLRDVMRRQEFGGVTTESLRTELLASFNELLKTGHLNKVDVKDLRVKQTAAR